MPLLQQQLQAAILAQQQANQINAPKAANADELFKAQLALQQAQTPNLQSETELNKFKLENPQYLSPEGWLFSQGMPGQQGGYTPWNQQGQQTQQNSPAQNQQTPQQQAPTSTQLSPNDYSNLTYAKAPQIGVNTGNPARDAYINSKFASPLDTFLANRAAEDYKFEESLYSNRLKDIPASNESARKILENVNLFDQSYDEITQAKGSVLGRLLPSYSNAAALNDRVSQALVNDGARMLQQGHITNTDFALVQKGMKLGRELPEETKETISNVMKGGAIRKLEENAAVAFGHQNKLPNDLIDRAFALYQQQRPAKNQNKGERYLNSAYLNTWKDYFTPEALDSIQKTGTYTPPNQEQLNKLNPTIKDVESAAKILKMNTKAAFKQFNDPNYVNTYITDADLEKYGNKLPKSIIYMMIQAKKGIKNG